MARIPSENRKIRDLIGANREGGKDQQAGLNPTNTKDGCDLLRSFEKVLFILV